MSWIFNGIDIRSYVCTWGSYKEILLCLICRRHYSSPNRLKRKSAQTAYWATTQKHGNFSRKVCLQKKIKWFIVSTSSALLTLVMHQHSCVRSHLPVSSRTLLCIETYLTENYEHRTADLTSQATVVRLQNIYSKTVFLKE